MTPQVCVMLDGGPCVKHDTTDFSSCTVRCWGERSDNVKPLPSPQHKIDPARNYPKPYDHHAMPHYPNPGEYPDLMWAGHFDSTWYGTRELGWEYLRVSPGPGVKTPQGTVGLAAGTGEPGYVDGPALQAQFNRPQGIVVDNQGDVYIADTFNHVIRRFGVSAGEVHTVAGTPGVPGYTDGDALTVARFDKPGGIALYYDWRLGAAGQAAPLVIVVADTDNHRLRKIHLGEVTTLAGLRHQSPRSGYVDGEPELAMFATPMGLAADHDGTVYVADAYVHMLTARGGCHDTLAH